MKSFLTAIVLLSFSVVPALAAKTMDRKARFAKNTETQNILAEHVPALFGSQRPKLGVRNVKAQSLWENSLIPSNDVTNILRARYGL